jgi:DNA segregation ATPase FtsK/SpoIIIE-like protein
MIRKSPRDILNVAPNASEKEITEAYRKMAKMYHPDKVAHLAPEFRELAEHRMKEINQAYQSLLRGNDEPYIQVQPKSTNNSLYNEAVIVATDVGRVSSALLQIRLRVGYAEAAKLIAQLERDGLIGPMVGSKPRMVLKAAYDLRSKIQ